MPRIRDLLSDLRDFATTQSPADQLKDLFQTLGEAKSGGYRYTGDIQEVTAFVGWLRKTIAAENKPGRLTGERDKALGAVEAALKDNPRQTVFSQIDPAMFYFDVAVRSREPRLMDQADAELCLPVGVILQMAKDEPDEYVKLAVRIYKCGWATLGGVRVEAHPEMRGQGSINGLGAADQVVLTSIRDSMAGSRRDEAGIGAVTTGEICNWLKRIGCQSIENRLIEIDWQNNRIGLFNGVLKYPNGLTQEILSRVQENHLRMMARKLETGSKIIMLQDGQLGEMAVLKKVSLPVLQGSSHAGYVGKCQLSATHVVRIKFYEFGAARILEMCELKHFLPHFLGYIAY